MTAVDFDDVKVHLNITSNDNDAELASFVYAAEAHIAQRVGPLEPTTTTSTVTSNGFSLVLPVTPVISVTTVTATYWGTDMNVTALSVDPASGVVHFAPRAPGLAAGVAGSPYVGATYTVVYEAGRDIIPDDLALAVKEMVRHLWTTQRGGGRRPGSNDSPPTPGFLIPYAVAELLQPHMQFGFA